MARTFIRNTEQLNEFVESVCGLDKKVTHIAYDLEAERWFKKDEIRLSSQMTLAGIGIYAGEGKEAYIIHSDKIDYESLNVLFTCYPTVFHNCKFDVPFLVRLWIMMFPDDVELHDTMLMSYVQDESKMRHGLKPLAKSILKVDPDDVTAYGDVWDIPELRKPQTLFDGDENDMKTKYAQELEDWHFKMWNYCIDDCMYTYKLYNHFKKILLKEDSKGRLWKVYNELEMPFMRVLMDMEVRGISIDEEYLKKLEGMAEEKIVDITAKIYKEAGRQFDINSPKQVGEVLFWEMWYKPSDEFKTETWSYSTNSQALKYLAKEHDAEICKHLLDYREISKLYSTYITSMPKLAVDGIIHCNWKQTGTKTGRISSSQPNLQNIPRRDDEFNIRAAFKPREWYAFVISDYSQVELRIMAYESQDPRLVKTYQEGWDIHQATADAIGCSRTVAKTINFWLNYWRTAYGMATALGISSEEAQQFIDTYFEKYPKVKDFMRTAIHTVKKKKYVQTLTGRRRRFNNYNRLPVPKWKVWEELEPWQQKACRRERDKTNKAIERMATNAIIQWGAADIMKIAMRNMRKALKPRDSHILLQIHDEVVVECPKEHAEKVMEIVRTEMENAVSLPWVPLVSDPKITDEWEK